MFKRMVFSLTLLSSIVCFGAAAPDPKLDPKYKDGLVLYQFKSGDILWFTPTYCVGAQFHESSQNSARLELVYKDSSEWEKEENLQQIYLFDSELKEKKQEDQAKKEKVKQWNALKKEKLKEWRKKALEHEHQIRLKHVLNRASAFLKEPIEGIDS